MEQNFEKTLIDQLTQEIKHDPNILAVILYGSYLKNELYNDIDICLISFPGKEIPLNKFLHYKGNYHSLLDIQFFDDLPIYVQSRVVEEGKILLNKDFDILFEIYEKTIRSFSDFYPHYKLYLEVD